MNPGEKNYKNNDITVYWKPASCIHASTCVNELPLVFSPEKRPWVKMENAGTDEIIEVVDKCPVDALTWKWNDESMNNAVGVEHPNHINNRRKSVVRDEAVATEKSTEIKVIENGPLIIKGNFSIERENGTRSKFNGTVSICRCGRTKLPPFCDGSHREAHT